MTERGVQIKHVLITAAVSFVLAYGALRMWTTQGNALPEINWFTVAVLVLMAALVLAGGWQIRNYRMHKGAKMPSPQLARRTVVAAQASAAVGAALTGWYAGHVAVALDNLDSDRLQAIAIVAAVSTLGAAGLSAVGLVVQHWCRIDEDDDDTDGPRGGATAA